MFYAFIYIYLRCVVVYSCAEYVQFRINGTTKLLSHLNCHCATVVMLSINTSFKGIKNKLPYHHLFQTFLLIKFSMYIIIIPHFFIIASVINFLVVKSPLYYSNSTYYSDSTVPYTTLIVQLLPTHYLQN